MADYLSQVSFPLVRENPSNLTDIINDENEEFELQREGFSLWLEAVRNSEEAGESVEAIEEGEEGEEESRTPEAGSQSPLFDIAFHVHRSFEGSGLAARAQPSCCRSKEL